MIKRKKYLVAVLSVALIFSSLTPFKAKADTVNVSSLSNWDSTTQSIVLYKSPYDSSPDNSTFPLEVIDSSGNVLEKDSNYTTSVENGLIVDYWVARDYIETKYHSIYTDPSWYLDENGTKNDWQFSAVGRWAWETGSINGTTKYTKNIPKLGADGLFHYIDSKNGWVDTNKKGWNASPVYMQGNSGSILSHSASMRLEDPNLRTYPDAISITGLANYTPTVHFSNPVTGIPDNTVAQMYTDSSISTKVSELKTKSYWVDDTSRTGSPYNIFSPKVDGALNDGRPYTDADNPNPNLLTPGFLSNPSGDYYYGVRNAKFRTYCEVTRTVYKQHYTKKTTPIPSTGGSVNYTLVYVDKSSGQEVGKDKSPNAVDTTLYGFTYIKVIPNTSQTPSGYTLTAPLEYQISSGYTSSTYSGFFYASKSFTDSHGENIYVHVNKNAVQPQQPTTQYGTVIKRYFLNGSEQNNDEQPLNNESVGSRTYNVDKSYTGYTCNNSPVTVNVIANDTVNCDFYFDKNPPTILPPTAYISAPSNGHQGSTVNVTGSGSDPQGQNLTYHWSTSDGQSISDKGGNIILGSSPITVNLYVTNESGVNSPTVTKTISPANTPPTVTLNLPQTIALGDDLNVIANGYDADGDPVVYSWTTPNDMSGTMTGNKGTVHFDTLGDKTFTVIVTDPFEATGTATAKTTVVEPIPTVNINLSGNLKENRKVTLSSNSSSGSSKYTIDNTKTKWQFYDVSGNELTVDNNPTSSTLVKSLSSTTGVNGLDFIVKKAGIYTAKCTVYNSYGKSATATKEIDISEDLPPIVDCYAKDNAILRDSNNNDLATLGSYDKSTSPDNDNIQKRVWVYCFDSNNDGSWIDEKQWMVYDNGSWRVLGDFNALKNLDIDTINSGNLTQIAYSPYNVLPSEMYPQGHGTSVGWYITLELAKEDFTDTIPQLITSKDKKVGKSWSDGDSLEHVQIDWSLQSWNPSAYVMPTPTPIQAKYSNKMQEVRNTPPQCSFGAFGMKL